MAIKEENEITVRVLCTEAELQAALQARGFSDDRRFFMDDRYLVPAGLDLKSLSPREILARAVLLRHITDAQSDEKKISFKQKEINDAGEILHQRAINCAVGSIEEALALFSALGYTEIMRIKESDRVFVRGDMELAVKFVENSDILIEFETCEAYDSVEKLKAAMNGLQLPIDQDDYFVKKAENVLRGILKSAEDA